MEDSAQQRWNGAVRGAIRNIAAKPDDMTRRGWSSFADTRQITFFKNNRRGSAVQTFSRGSVSAKMAIRSAAICTSVTFGFTNQRDGDFSIGDAGLIV